MTSPSALTQLLICTSMGQWPSLNLPLSTWRVTVPSHPSLCPCPGPITVPGPQPACSTSSPVWPRDGSCRGINERSQSSAPVPPSLIKSYLQLFIYKQGGEKLNSQVHTAEIKTQSICQPTWRAQCQKPGEKPKFLKEKQKQKKKMWGKEEKTSSVKDGYCSQSTAGTPVPTPW